MMFFCLQHTKPGYFWPFAIFPRTSFNRLFCTALPNSGHFLYHVSLPDKYFSAFTSYLDCCVWGGLSVFWQFLVPLYCGGFSLWVGLNEWLVEVSWLGKLVLVFLWVELDFSLWSAMKCPVMSYEMSMGLE